MSKVKNISGGPRYVPLLDMEVEDGEVVDVPDFQPGHNPDSQPGDPDHLPIIWPDTTWEPVTEKTAKTTARTAADDSTTGKADA